MARLTLFILLLVAAAAEAQSGSGDEWLPLNLVIVNDSEVGDLGCQVLLAHWFEETAGPVAAGGRVTVPLIVRPETGEVAILNAVGDRMRVERLACRYAGTHRRDWAEPPLDRLRDPPPRPVLTCRSADGETLCGFD